MWNDDSVLGLYGSSLLQNPAANLGVTQTAVVSKKLSK